jgi:hypothetical protein
VDLDWRDDLVLTIWQARNLLAEIEAFPETDEISNTLGEVEDVLLNLILRIVATCRSHNPSPLRLISSFGEICC